MFVIKYFGHGLNDPHFLCNDGLWRDMPLFGNTRGCAKDYPTIVGAKRQAKRWGGSILNLPMDCTFSGGKVVKTIPAGEGMVKYEHRDVKEYILPI